MLILVSVMIVVKMAYPAYAKILKQMRFSTNYVKFLDFPEIIEILRFSIK